MTFIQFLTLWIFSIFRPSPFCIGKKNFPIFTRRVFAKKIFDAAKYEEPWFGIEQEYTILQNENKFAKRPFGWPEKGYPSN